MGDSNLADLEHEKRLLEQRSKHLDIELDDHHKELAVREGDLKKKVALEKSIVDRYKDFLAEQEAKLAEQ